MLSNTKNHLTSNWCDELLWSKESAKPTKLTKAKPAVRITNQLHPRQRSAKTVRGNGPDQFPLDDLIYATRNLRNRFDEHPRMDLYSLYISELRRNLGLVGRLPRALTRANTLATSWEQRRHRPAPPLCGCHFSNLRLHFLDCKHSLSSMLQKDVGFVKKRCSRREVKARGTLAEVERQSLLDSSLRSTFFVQKSLENLHTRLH